MIEFETYRKTAVKSAKLDKVQKLDDIFAISITDEGVCLVTYDRMREVAVVPVRLETGSREEKYWQITIDGARVKGVPLYAELSEAISRASVIAKTFCRVT